MGRNRTSERKVSGKSAPGALVSHSHARDAGVMPRAVRGRSTTASRPARRRQPPIRAAYEHFRLERQGALVSPTTLDFYDAMVLPFLTWLDAEGVERFDHLAVDHARLYRARLASAPGRHGRPLQPDTLHDSHRAIGTFLRWASKEGYRIDGRIFELAAPRVPDKEPSVYHIAQLRRILAACNPEVPSEDLMVRLLVGSGIRRAEVCGLAVTDWSVAQFLQPLVDPELAGLGPLPVQPRAGALARGRRRLHQGSVIVSSPAQPAGKAAIVPDAASTKEPVPSPNASGASWPSSTRTPSATPASAASPPASAAPAAGASSPRSTARRPRARRAGPTLAAATRAAVARSRPALPPAGGRQVMGPTAHAPDQCENR
jgi:hypothetical protein